MQIRNAEPSDAQALAALWTVAFPGRRTAADRVRQLETGIPYGGIESAYIAEERGRLIGAFRAYRLTEWIAGSPLPMLGLAAVATAPDARRRGVGRALCRHAIRLGRGRGDVVSVLYPFRPSFYHGLGWGLVGELHAYRFAPDALPEHVEAAGVRPAGAGDRDEITACYARVAERSNGPIDRDARAWAHHLDPPGVYAFVFEDDVVRGYLTAHFARRRDARGATLRVRELVAEDETARRGLLGWISAQRDAFREVRYDARPDERLDLLLSDPRPPRHGAVRPLWFPVAGRTRGPMLRVLDVPAALAARRHWGGPPGVGLTLEIEVEDEEAPGNRGPWEVAIEERGARVHPRRGGGYDARLAIGAAAFAQVYAGELTPRDAARLGLARIDGAADALERAFRLPMPFWLGDEF
ncbi:MAG TPA: GNAT family N-acetyltransferase [Longimicrobiales bacterium]